MNNSVNFDPLAWAAADINNNSSAPNLNRQAHNETCPVNNRDTELAKAQAVAEELIARGANIAESYDDYLRLGFALAHGLGNDGRELYHRLCKQSPKYREGECEAKWQQCLNKADGRITLATFYQMARQAGVDISAVSRQFVPLVPSCHDSTEHMADPVNEYEKHIQHTDNQFVERNCQVNSPSSSAFTDSRGKMAQVAQTGMSEQETMFQCYTFSDKLNTDDLPSLVRDAMMTQTTTEGRDMVVLAVLNLASGFMHKVSGIYDKRRVYAPFFLLVIAPSGADKGMLPACLALTAPIVNEIRSKNEEERKKYRTQKAQYEALDRKQRATATEPEEPSYRSPIIAVNASATAFYQDLAANDGWGAVFETEADTVTQSIKQDYGDYSSGLRKAFHHETIEYSRRKDNEHVYIGEPKMSALITCTPGQVPLMLSPQNTENGLANRFVFYTQNGGHYWRDVFEDGEQTLFEQMAPLGQQFLSLYHDMESREAGKLVFTFNEEQKQRFNGFFEPLYHEQIGLYGDDLDAFVKRLGLVTFRIAMVLTVLRHADQQPAFCPLDEPLVCTDTDFQTAITIADCLINHTVQVYKNLLPHNDVIIGNSGRSMNPQEQRLYHSLPTVFKTAELIEIAQKIGIPQRTAQRYLGNYINEFNLMTRVSQGNYSKKQQHEKSFLN